MSKSKKKCLNCNRSISEGQFYSTNNPLFADGKVPICKSCINDLIDPNNEKTLQEVLQRIDRPFIAEVWEDSFNKKPDKPIGEYFRRINSLPQYKSLLWKNSDFTTRGKRTIKEREDNNVTEEEAPVAGIKITKELKSKWGNYSDREIIEMEKIYQDMVFSNDISTPQHKKNLHFYCKLSVLMDKALDEGDFSGYEKLSRQFKELTASSGFRPIDRKSGSESSGVRTFSQIFEEVEKDGFIEPYDVDLNQDIVDKTIMYLLNYTRKLLNVEQLHSPPSDTPSVSDQEGDDLDWV